jgi:hypothetical protein
MRIAVISDIHGNFAALDAVLNDIRGRGVDATVALGDHLSGPFDPRAVADAIITSGMPCVRGNHDRWLVEGREPDKDWAVDVWVRGVLSLAHSDWLKTMPATQVFAGEVFMCHATPQDDVSFWMDQLTEAYGVLATIIRCCSAAIHMCRVRSGSPTAACCSIRAAWDCRFSSARPMRVTPSSRSGTASGRPRSTPSPTTASRRWRRRGASAFPASPRR